VKPQKKFKQVNRFLKDMKIAGGIVLIISIVTVGINYFLMGWINWEVVSQQILYNTYYGVPLSIINGWFFDYLEPIYPWDEQPRRRVLWGIIGSFLITMATIFLLNIILWSWIWGDDFSVVYSPENRSFYVIAVIITVVISTVLHAISFYKEVQQEKQINARLRQEKLLTELNALRAHVDPHFLFNSFNVLSGLIDEDPEKAQTFLAGLSKIYRYILEQRNTETTTLQEEIAFAKKYLSLQKMRFEDSIKLELAIEEELQSKKIPTLTLQLLLENAIKHNRFDERMPLRIELKTEAGQLIVQNNKLARTNLEEGNKIGLRNIQDRYALMGEHGVEIVDRPEIFMVKLPLL